MTQRMATGTGKKTCPNCGSERFTGLQYQGTCEDYDGVSEWICEDCGKHWGRWTGREILPYGDIERRYGGER